MRILLLSYDWLTVTYNSVTVTYNLRLICQRYVIMYDFLELSPILTENISECYFHVLSCFKMNDHAISHSNYETVKYSGGITSYKYI